MPDEGIETLFGSFDENLRSLESALGVTLLLPFLMGLAVMNRYLIPNVGFLVLGRQVGDQNPWTTPGERGRMARAWSRIWGEILGR